MKRQYRCAVIVGLLLAVLLTGTGRTSAAEAPLLMLLGDGTWGDIFSYTPGVGLKNMTSYGYNNTPVLSPDGKQVAYASVVNPKGRARSGPLSRNIWLMDVATGNAKRIAFQPADQTPDKNGIAPFTARSEPVWSPDGKSLAWLEERYTSTDDTADHLMLYSVAKGTATEIYQQPIFCAGGPCSDLNWTNKGITILSAETPAGPFTLKVLDLEGKTTLKTQLGDELDFRWIDEEDEAKVITHSEFINLESDSRDKTLPRMEIYSRSAPDGLHFLSYEGYYNTDWYLVIPDAEAITVSNATSFAISPDGKMAAYAVDNGSKLYLFDGHKTTQIKLSGVSLPDANTIQVSGLVWSPLGLRVSPDQ